MLPDSTSADFADLATDLLTAGHLLRFKVSGSSMQPVIRDGDVVQAGPITIHELRPGDIVLYRSTHNTLLVHRLHRRPSSNTGSPVQIKADACIGPIEHVSPDRILGRVTSLERDGNTVRLDSVFSRYAALATSRFRFLGRLLSRISTRKERRP